jgi:hypothetical protein
MLISDSNDRTPQFKRMPAEELLATQIKQQLQTLLLIFSKRTSWKSEKDKYICRPFENYLIDN